MSIKADYHVHSNFSGDSTADMEDVINQAINLGLTRLCFTDHMDYDFPEKYCSKFEFDVKTYFDKLSYLKDKYSSKIKILTGIEIGLIPYLNTRYDKLITSNNFDFVIGSSHLVDMMDPYYLEYWEDKTEREGYEKYFTSIVDNISSYDNFDTYGHIDYIVRYGPNKNKNYSYELYKDSLDKVLKTIISNQKDLEVNTAGYKYGLGAPHPQLDVLLRYRELGGEIITIGSDSHTPKHVAYSFDEACELLKKAGFRYYAVYEKRKPIMEKL